MSFDFQDFWHSVTSYWLFCFTFMNVFGYKISINNWARENDKHGSGWHAQWMNEKEPHYVVGAALSKMHTSWFQSKHAWRHSSFDRSHFHMQIAKAHIKPPADFEFENSDNQDYFYSPIMAPNANLEFTFSRFHSTSSSPGGRWTISKQLKPSYPSLQ